MANQLKMATRNAIIVLWRRGWSHRRIARELGVHRETVSRYVKHAREEDEPAKPAKVTPGTEAASGSKPAKVTPGNTSARSKCESFRQIIIDKLDMGLSAQRIYQDLVCEQDLRASYQSNRSSVLCES